MIETLNLVKRKMFCAQCQIHIAQHMLKLHGIAGGKKKDFSNRNMGYTLIIN